ncbi:MAG: rane protein [Actinomycetota bacterium]|nr:rane protein [Actinomycetota bacterium]
MDRYVDYNGYHYVASIAYFSLLSLIPMMLVAFSVAGFVLAGEPQLLDQLQAAITSLVPGSLGEKVGDLIKQFVDQRANVGVLGLAVGLYSGWNWINALRDALTAMWDQQRPPAPLLRVIVRDLMALLSLTVALIVSFALTASGGALGKYLLKLAGLDDESWAHTVISIGSVPLALLADWLVFLWVLAKLPREAVGMRSAMRGAAAAALGFELLKQAGSIYLGLVSRSPTGAAFGSIIGLLFFISLVSRLLVFITAWTATARDAPRKLAPPPASLVLRPVELPAASPAAPAAAGVLAGVLGTLAFQRWRRSSR